jgi:uncharacterized protein YndB with AHSA1/START domain
VTSSRHATLAPALLEVRRLIAASHAQVLWAWTTPGELKKWWGPENVRCVDAEVDLRVGGKYRIANEFPDKSVLWIEGEFETVDKPSLLVYTWRIASAGAPTERVTVRFEGRDAGTEVMVRHERIATAQLRGQHEAGWVGCLEGLAEYWQSRQAD